MKIFDAFKKALHDELLEKIKFIGNDEQIYIGTPAKLMRDVARRAKKYQQQDRKNQKNKWRRAYYLKKGV